MLTELKLANFRIFDDEVTIRFRPITVLIGKNNAGKSSAIKFLSMLRQSIGAHGGPFLSTKGEHVDLGNRFFDLKNTRSRKKGLKFNLCVQGGESPADVVGQFLKQKGIDPYVYKPQYQVFADILYNKRGVFQGKSWGMTLSANSEKALKFHAAITENSKFLDFISERQEQIANTDSAALNLAIQHCVELIGQSINAIDHIAPSRTGTKRTIDVGRSIPITHVGSDGRYALHHLFALWEQHSESGGQREKYKFVLEHLQKILDIEAINFLGRGGDLVQCEAINAKTGARANIANFGFGVSQCLPIFVQGAIMHPGATLMVEQPEAQVHPTAQLDLGGYIARLWQERKVSSIVETHSSNLLLRLRYLIAEGDGCLKPDDVSIAFFDLDEGKAVVKNLDIDQDGFIGDGLPMEFFGADIREGLKLSAAKYKGPDSEKE
ncbi:MAG: AAA family ATPase [Gammaproteobacteria bacterium]|nr:AAA family ATPase [Gammaproteobacteria bacterium]